MAVFRLGCDNSPGSSLFDEQAPSTERRQRQHQQQEQEQQALGLDVRKRKSIGFIVNCLCVSTRRWFPVVPVVPVERHIDSTSLGVVAPVTASKQFSACTERDPAGRFPDALICIVLGQGNSTPMRCQRRKARGLRGRRGHVEISIPVTLDRCSSHCPPSIVFWVRVTWRHHGHHLIMDHRECYRRRP